MTVKSRDTVDAGPFSLRTLTDEDFSLIRDFRDTRNANAPSLTGKDVEMRMLSPSACTELQQVQTCTCTFDRTEITQHGHADTSRDGGRNE